MLTVQEARLAEKVAVFFAEIKEKQNSLYYPLSDLINSV